MKINNLFKIAFKNIKSNKMRSILTMLGLVVGIASVIALVGIGQGASSDVTSEVSSLGTNIVTLKINDSDYSFNYEDISDFLTVDNVVSISPLKNVSATISRNTTSSSNTSIIASDQYYLDIMNYTLDMGRNISIIDIENNNKVCIIGSETAETYFNMSNPINETIKIDGDNYTVIGVLKENGSSSFGTDIDSSVIVPFSTLMYLGSDKSINNLYIEIEDEDKSDMTINILENYVRSKLQISTDYFTVSSQSSMIEAMSNINNTLSLLLGGIASISLIVGGIGVMNVMLVSVSERTKEIGIRKSLGAKRKDILLQFLIESLILCLLGGIIGIIVGMIAGEVASLIEYSFTSSGFIILLSASISLLIGLIFGIFPAYKASLLNPIDALRSE